MDTIFYFTLLLKEVAALREARMEEVNNLKGEIEQKEASLQKKDNEIGSLQQEVKRLLQMSIVSESSVREKFPDTKREVQNDDDILELRERLR